MTNLIKGAIAGFAATLPMTLAMGLLHDRLPEPEKYPLPPEEIELRIVEGGMLRQALDEPTHTVAAELTHFAYGTLSGVAYSVVGGRLPFPPIVKGLLFGFGWWAGNYLGWLPALGLLSPVTNHPPRRTLIMLGANVLWGGVAGLLLERLDQPDERR